MKIEPHVVSGGRPSAETSTMNPGAAWRASLEHALMDCLALAQRGTQAFPAEAFGDATLRSDARLPPAHRIGQANGQQSTDHGQEQRRTIEQEATTPVSGEHHRHALQRDQAMSQEVRSARLLRGHSTPGPMLVGPVVEGRPAPLTGEPTQSLPVGSTPPAIADIVRHGQGPAPLFAQPDSVVDNRPAEIRVNGGQAASFSDSKPLMRTAATTCRNPASQTYAPRLMHLVQGEEGVRINLRDATLASSQMAAVVQALFWRVESPLTSISEVYLNGRRFLRPELDAGGAADAPSSIVHPLPQEE